MEKELIKQSNSVTFARYKMSSWQINCLVNVINSIQPYLDMNIDWGLAEGEDYKKYFPLNNNFEFPITIPLKNIDKYEHFKDVKNEIMKMVRLNISYEYVDDENNKNFFTMTPFSYINVTESGVLTLYLPIRSLRWILQWCKNTQLTTFDRKSVLSLRGVYAKRIFQILSSFYRERIFKMKIEKLSEILMAPKYSVQDFERKILHPAFKEMISNPNSRLYFKYRLISEEKRKGAGRPKRDAVIFKVYDSNEPGSSEEFKTDNFKNE